jgi:hypothetical protein
MQPFPAAKSTLDESPCTNDVRVDYDKELLTSGRAKDIIPSEISDLAAAYRRL